ncbi:carboxylesterase, partial [Streptomyces sp. WM6386]
DALAADIAETLAAEIGLRPTVADLAGVDPRKLPEAGAALTGRMREYVHRWGAVALTPTPFSPVVDGEVLPSAPWEALADGAARDVELIAGHNRDEYRLFLLLGGLLGRVPGSDEW